MSAHEKDVKEVIFIGLPGPTHHYSGLSADNVASSLNRGNYSNPRQAALQALELARLLKSLGVETAIIPPQKRPHMGMLRQYFKGENASLIKQASHEAKRLLEKASSSSAMWVANAATIVPATDTGDKKLHITVANLFTNMHRRIEAEETYALMRTIFKNIPDCVLHLPLSAAAGMHDEGAANHMRLVPRHSDKGLHVFVYGTEGNADDLSAARQSLSASQAIMAQSALSPRQALFIKQNPLAIAAGVFHNDVIAVNNERILLMHELAFANGQKDIERVELAYADLNNGKKSYVQVIDSDQLSLEEAVHTYFFNSQIVTRDDGGMTVIAPTELQDLYEGKAARLMEKLCSLNHIIDEIRYIDLKQSMRNGGGPACLRLRIVLTGAQLIALRQSVRVLADDILLGGLEKIIRAYYLENLVAADLGDPDHYRRSCAVTDECYRLMRLSQS